MSDFNKQVSQLFIDLKGQEPNKIEAEKHITEPLGPKLVQKEEHKSDLDDNINHPSLTKYYVIRKLIDLFLHSEQGEKAIGRGKILTQCTILIWSILAFEAAIIILQGLKIINLDKITFLGTIGTITSGVVFLLKTITKSLYNDESDKVLKTVETVVNKL